MSKTRDAYERRLSDGGLQPDPAQAEAVRVLEGVEAHLDDDKPKGRLDRLLHGRSSPMRGAYLWGPPGRGKSMLMDMFCEAAPVKAKRRVHFHAFMGEVQDRLNALRREQGHSHEDVVLRAADELAEGLHLLCFDELEVIDIADAMILGRLFERLFEHGVVLVATSNEAPDDLYRDGINRQLFEPFIDLIKTHTQVTEVGGPHDYRRGRARAEQRYWSSVTPDSRAAFDAAWARQSSSGVGDVGKLSLHGRTLKFRTTAGDKLRATFEELCAANLGADDYLAVAKRFHTVFLGPVPVLRANLGDPARRFVILIDTLYEAKASLWMLAEAEPDRLIELGDEASLRAVSRLNEMRSASWPPRP